MPERFRGLEGHTRLVEQLAKQRLFRGERAIAIAKELAKFAELEEYKEGQEIYHEGQPAKHKLYFILTGEFDVLVRGSRVTVKEKEQAVGEFPIIDSSLNYTVTVKARESSIVAAIREVQFLSIAGEYMEIWKNMAEVLVKRLHATTHGLVPIPKSPCVFIGHGRSRLWKDLKGFIQGSLRLEWEEFNRAPVAGITNIARLSAMLDSATIAFLIMTGEDEQADGGLHARTNVVHEAGLFQGKLGFERAIILLEKGCQKFSNIHGLGQIRFPRGNIKAAFKKIRKVLEREGLIAAATIALIDKRRKILGESIGTVVSTHETKQAAIKANEAFQKRMRESGVKDHVPTKIVTLKVRLGDGEQVNPAVHLFQEGEKSGRGEG